MILHVHDVVQTVCWFHTAIDPRWYTEDWWIPTLQNYWLDIIIHGEQHFWYLHPSLLKGMIQASPVLTYTIYDVLNCQSRFSTFIVKKLCKKELNWWILQDHTFLQAHLTLSSCMVSGGPRKKHLVSGVWRPSGRQSVNSITHLCCLLPLLGKDLAELW